VRAPVRYVRLAGQKRTYRGKREATFEMVASYTTLRPETTMKTKRTTMATRETCAKMRRRVSCSVEREESK
jgi:hypothetical protein